MCCDAILIIVNVDILECEYLARYNLNTAQHGKSARARHLHSNMAHHFQRLLFLTKVCCQEYSAECHAYHFYCFAA
jgi:hypothetical protein